MPCVCDYRLEGRWQEDPFLVMSIGPGSYPINHRDAKCFVISANHSSVSWGLRRRYTPPSSQRIWPHLKHPSRELAPARLTAIQLRNSSVLPAGIQFRSTKEGYPVSCGWPKSDISLAAPSRQRLMQYQSRISVSQGCHFS